MNIFFYMRLAAQNIRKNAGTYIPYICTCVVTIMMFYVIKSLSVNPGLRGAFGGAFLGWLLSFGVYVIGLFALVFLFYTNSFLMKRRKREFGLFNILGLEKKHLIRILFLETLYVAIFSVFLGIFLGIALDKAMFLLITRMLEAPVTLGFFVSGKVMAVTAAFFCGIFALIFLKSVPMLQFSNPIDLLRGSSVGEREPKTKGFLAVLGAGLLAAGYALSLTIENPITAVPIIFVAVILVIAATYLLFTAGSIALLKLLKKNKNYYYKAKHFISVSGMIYRMKQNAVGLANICILSTMVLVMVSTTGSLMAGLEDNLRVRYPRDFNVYLYGADREQLDSLREEVRLLAGQEQLGMENEFGKYNLCVTALQKGNVYYTDKTVMKEADAISAMSEMREVYLVALSEYNRQMGKEEELQADEVLLYCNRGKNVNTSLVFMGTEYKIVRTLDEFPENGRAAMNMVTSHTVVVSDRVFQELSRKIEADADNLASARLCYYGFDTGAGEEAQTAFRGVLAGRISQTLGLECTIEIREQSRTSFMELYGGLFFLGIFLGALFVMAMVLIIYYKQISEGYEDRERFVIMQKVGMSRGEVKAAIHSQVLTVFFLPLLAAGIHVAAAFPLMKMLLALLNMVNVRLYMLFTLSCFLVFAVLYMLIYGMTARTYYKIVSR